MSLNPEVSIIVPTYNRKALLSETIKSVQAQTFRNWECIIVDDGSNDGTCAFLEEVKRSDVRFRFFRRPEVYSKGPATCRNFGLEKSRGNYIQWLDDDDLISEEKLELQVASLKKLPHGSYFTTCSWDLYWPGKTLDLKKIVTEEKIIRPKEFFDVLREKQTFLPASTYLIPRSLSMGAGPWNPLLTLNDDAEYFTRILLQAKGLHYTEGCFVLYREHSGLRLSRKKDNEGLESFFLSLRLMHANLLKKNILVTPYFHWKLKRILLQNTNDHWCILRRHRFFFLEHGINLRKIKYYKARFIIYKKLYPVYKSLLKSSGK